MPQRCLHARVRSAAPKTGAPLPAARRCGEVYINDGRLRRDHEAEAGHVGHRPTTPEYAERVTHPILQNLTNTT